MSTLGLDHISWRYLKEVIKDSKYATNIVNIVIICINLSYWPLYFKKPMSIIIFKPNKSAYDNLKAFYPIVLLNMLEKLIEKVISNRIQVHSIAFNFLHPNQLGSIKQHLTTDAGLFLTYLIQAGLL